MADENPKLAPSDEERQDPPGLSVADQDANPQQPTSVTTEDIAALNTKGNGASLPSPLPMPQSPPEDATPDKKGMTSESTTKAAAPAEAIIRIEQEPANTRASSTGRNLIFGLSRPIFGLVAIYGLFMSGSAAYFFSQFLKVPGLDNQIEKLEKQVDELEGQILELEKEVDRLAETVVALGEEVTRLTEANEEAERIVAEFEKENEQLADSNERLKVSNEELAAQLQVFNETNMELQDNVNNLTEQNNVFAGLIATQNKTIDELNFQVNALENATETLNTTVMELEVQVAELENQTAALQATNDELQANINNLTDQVNDLSEQNEELQQINDELRELLRYFEESLGDFNQTFEEAIAELNRLIEVNSKLVVSNVEQTDRQTSSNWECTFHDAFAGLPFMEDLDTPIGATDYDEVMNDVNENLLEELCLDRANVEANLSSEYGLANPPVTITVNQLERGVNSYVSQALEYYFPPRGGSGLTTDDWVAADFDCQNLPADKKFSL